MIIIKKLNGNEQTHTFVVSAKIARVGMLLERFYDRRNWYHVPCNSEGVGAPPRVRSCSVNSGRVNVGTPPRAVILREFSYFT